MPAEHLRQHLMACGLLPPVDPHLIGIEAWMRRRLAAIAAHPHERLLRPFAVWHQLPRLHADAATRPLRATAKQYATGQFVRAELFLSWLHDRGIDPATLTQPDVDTWYVTHRVHQRHLIRGFLLWATEHGHLPQGLCAPRVVFRPGGTFTQQRRLELLRRYLGDTTVPVAARVAVVRCCATPNRSAAASSSPATTCSTRLPWVEITVGRMDILVVGGSGFLGQELTHRAVTESHRVMATYNTHAANIGRVDWRPLDIRRPDDLTTQPGAGPPGGGHTRAILTCYPEQADAPWWRGAATNYGSPRSTRALIAERAPSYGEAARG